MTYEVLARKWRPQQFDDVIGQDHVTQTLRNAIKINRVAHAYLFVGPRGIGKTSIARIFAKALNCEKGTTKTPCDKCSSCTEIAAGSNLDVQEIDGASNRGIDEIRALRDAVKYMPIGRYKIYIIDEVHMLTTEAFNALLKTLEEPPPNIKFFFATTEPQKVPATILSRCQRFDLRRIPVKLIVERLALIAKTEKVTIDDDALLAIARSAEGGLRDAESALDQLISFQGNNIRENDVLSVFGLVARQALEELSSALLKGDIVTAIRLVEDFDKQGKDMQRVLIELLEHCRNLLVFLQAGKDIVGMDSPGTLIDVLKTQAALTDPERLLRITDILMETMDRLRYALSKKTLLETAMIRCARASVVVSLDDILVQVQDLKNSLLGEPAVGPGISISAESSRESIPPPHLDLFPDKRTVQESEKAISAQPHELSRLKREWHSIIERVGKVAVLAKSCLLDAEPAAVNGALVTIGFDPEFSDRIEQVNIKRNRNALQKVLSEVLRRPVSVDFKVMEKLPQNQALEQSAPAVSGTDASDVNNKKPPGKAPKTGKKKWFSNEAVQKTMDMFNGNIIEIKE